MTQETPRLEVFQDLSLRGPIEDLPKLRQALLNHIVAPWSLAEDQPKPVGLDGDLLRFQRAASEGISAATLVLFSQPDGYWVANIVPIEMGQLTYGQYNAVLQDFERQIARDAGREVGFEVVTTAPRQSIEDWLHPPAVRALRRFSSAANKSTGSAHPADRERWYKFLIEAHTDKGVLEAGGLRRWLIEVEGWDEDSASKLAIEYEFGLGLLELYDPQ
jgi:hypothetical protein